MKRRKCRFSWFQKCSIPLIRDFHFACPGWHRYTLDCRRAHEILFVAQSSSSRDCHSARADVRPTGAAVFRAFLRHWSTLAPCLRRSSSVSGRPLSSRHWQRSDPPQHVAEQPTGQMPFCQQEPVVPGMLHQPASGFHQPLLETRERPALDPRRQDQSAPEVARRAPIPPARGIERHRGASFSAAIPAAAR